MRLAGCLYFGYWRLLQGEVRNYRALRCAGTPLCVYLWVFLYRLRLTSSLPLFRCIVVSPEGTQLCKNRGRKTRELLALTLVGKHAHPCHLPSQSPRCATFPCSTSCSNGSLQKRRDTVINQQHPGHRHKTQIHSDRGKLSQCHRREHVTQEHQSTGSFCTRSQNPV